MKAEQWRGVVAGEAQAPGVTANAASWSVLYGGEVEWSKGKGRGRRQSQLSHTISFHDSTVGGMRAGRVYSLYRPREDSHFKFEFVRVWKGSRVERWGKSEDTDPGYPKV